MLYLYWAPYFEHRSLLLTDEHADVWVAEVSAIDLFVPASGVNVCEGLVDLEGPHPFVVDPIGGDTPLLTERPKTYGPIGTA